MTHEFDVSLRRRMESLAAAVPISPPGDVTAVFPRGVRTTSTSRLAVAGLVPVIALVVVGTLLASLAGVGPFAGSTSMPPIDGPSPSHEPMKATTVSGDFELTIRSAKSHYAVDEPIEVEATFSYIGEEPVHILHSREGSPLDFGIVEPVLGGLILGPAGELACIGTMLDPGYIETADFAKSASWTSEDPLAQEYEAFVLDPELRLSEGTWHVYAVAPFSIDECGEPIEMRAELEIEVVGDVPETPAPSVPVTEPGVVALDARGELELELSASKAHYERDEAIQLSTSWAYIGPDSNVTVAHYHPEIAFAIEELDVQGATVRTWMDDSLTNCSMLPLVRDEPREAPTADTALVTVTAASLPEGLEGRGEPQLGSRFDPGNVRLPDGRWRITAAAEAWRGSCDDQGPQVDSMQATIEVSVGPTTRTVIELTTQAEPETGCRPEYHEGRLVRYPGTGLGITDDFGVAVGVVWPFGYSAREEAGVASLLGPDGQILAREHEFIGLSGPGPGQDRRIYACAGARRIEPVRSIDRAGGFQLALEARPHYVEGEEIDAVLTLENIRIDEPPFVLAQTPLVSLSVIEVNAERHAEFEGDGCGPFGYYKIGEPNEMPYVLRWGYGTTASPQSFYDLVVGDELRLPAGSWRLVASTRLWGDECGAPNNTVELEVEVTIEVE